MNFKELLENGYTISKGIYSITKHSKNRRYNKNNYSLQRISMGGWCEIGCNGIWEEFVEYVKKETGDLFIGIK